MKISCYSIMLNLLLASSIVSANPMKSLSRRGKMDFVEPSKMDVKCNRRTYTSVDLDTAATEVCSRTREQTHCRDYISCYYLKKLIPAVPKVSMYSGNLFSEFKVERSLYEWPLPKRNLFESTLYYAIVSFDPRSNRCKSIGAIKYTDKRNHDRCSISTKYDGFSSPRRSSDVLH